MRIFQRKVRYNFGEQTLFLIEKIRIASIATFSILICTKYVAVDEKNVTKISLLLQKLE